MHSIDLFIQNYFSLARTQFFTEFFYIATSTFNVSLYFFGLIFFVSLLIYLVRSFSHSMLFLATLFVGAATVFFLKNFFAISRPLDGVMMVHGQSFPSYHATLATIFFIILIYIFNPYFTGLKRIFFNLFCALAVLFIAFSRLYLGVHWLSDVVFGIILGALIDYFAIFIWKRIKTTPSTASVIK